MDACLYCKNYHPLHEVCDAYINKLENGAVTPEHQLEQRVDMNRECEGSEATVIVWSNPVQEGGE